MGVTMVMEVMWGWKWWHGDDGVVVDVDVVVVVGWVWDGVDGGCRGVWSAGDMGPNGANVGREKEWMEEGGG
ncbi:hypothetical protein Tco_0937457 [Tanacetum coccineum]|uniref:Uncharacterized protein n=1 Tax=Tanacetum coccineum TaxID=301880 RepID=A0ABQ5DGX3_9ASTR